MRLFVNGYLVIGKRREGRKAYVECEGQTIPVTEIRCVEAECCNCHKLHSRIRMFRIWYLMLTQNKSFFCPSCNRLGDKNGFFGKRHTNETKADISSHNRGRLVGDKNPSKRPEVRRKLKDRARERIEQAESLGLPNPFSKYGESNPFFGKKHSKESREKAGRGISEAYRSLTPEEKLQRRLKLKESIIKIKHQEYYLKGKRAGGKASAISQNRKWQMNKLEAAVRDELQRMGIEMEYSVILGHYQFDFGHKDSRVLLEVQGDYWHGNPEIYGSYNLTQRSMRLRDKAKREWAAQHGFLLFEIWEKEVNEGNFQTLRELHDAIQSNSGVAGRT